jgi:hypothetical protein
MVRDSRADHLHAADQVVLDPKRLGEMNARYASGETAHVGGLAIGQLDLAHRAVHVEHAVRPCMGYLLLLLREKLLDDPDERVRIILAGDVRNLAVLTDDNVDGERVEAYEVLG